MGNQRVGDEETRIESKLSSLLDEQKHHLEGAYGCAINTKLKRGCVSALCVVEDHCTRVTLSFLDFLFFTCCDIACPIMSAQRANHREGDEEMGIESKLSFLSSFIPTIHDLLHGHMSLNRPTNVSNRGQLWIPNDIDEQMHHLEGTYGCALINSLKRGYVSALCVVEDHFKKFTFSFLFFVPRGLIYFILIFIHTMPASVSFYFILFSLF